MKKLRLIGLLALLVGLGACSKEDDARVIKTHTRESMLCMSPWEFDRTQIFTRVNSKTIHDTEYQECGRLTFYPTHEADLHQHKKYKTTLKWLLKDDTLTLAGDKYLITALSANRLELLRNTNTITPKGVEFTQTRQKFIR